MDIPTAGLPIAHKLCPILLKYQKLIDFEIKLIENADYISKSLSPWATPVIIVPKKPDPLNPYKQWLCLLLDYSSLNKPINAAHNGNNITYYYPLPNIRDLLARLQNYTIFSSLDPRSGYQHIGSTSEAKSKTSFATASNKWH